MYRLYLSTMLLLLTAAPSSAASITFFRGLRFESHSTSFDLFTNQTLVVDTYSISELPLDLLNDSYDALEFDIGVATGNRLEVDDVTGAVTTSIHAGWERADVPVAQIVNPYAVSYVNGLGDLPAESGSGILALSSSGDVIDFADSLPQVTGGFSFERMRISSTFGPYDAGGIYNNRFNQLTFSYSVPGNVADPGPFTAIVPEPTSLMLLAVGAVFLSCTRRRQAGAM